MPGSPIRQTVVNPFDVSTGSGAAGITDVATVYGRSYSGLQAAINAANADTALPSHLWLSRGEWGGGTKVTIPANCRVLTIEGEPHDYGGTDGTVLTATGAITSVLELLSTYHTLRNLRIDAARLATYGIYGLEIASCNFENVFVQNALFDGIHSAVTGNNNSVICDAVWAVNNGTLYATAGIMGEYSPLLDASQAVTITGTADTTANNATITIVGSSTDLTTLGIRSGDFVRVGSAPVSTAYVGMVASVTSNTIVVQSIVKPFATATGQDFAIGVGHGVNLIRQGNNNIWHFRKGLFRGNGASGINVQALFGSTLDSVQCDNNAFFGVAAGLADGSSATLNTTLIAPYFESNGAGAMWIHQCVDITVISPTIEASVPLVRPQRDTAGRARGVLIYDGLIMKLQSGWESNFVVELENDAGTLKHRIISDIANATAPQFLDLAVTGSTTTKNATPNVTSVVDFTAGVGIDNAATHRLILNTGVASNGQSGADHWDVTATIEFNSIGTTLNVYPAKLSHNVNGTTNARLVLHFTNATDGTDFGLTTANIAAGKKVSVRVRGYLKR